MSIKKSIVAAIAGNALEYYDVTLYSFFAIMLVPLFFPTSDPIAAKIIGLNTIAAGFVMRPLGGIIFGHIGDRLGRKKALTVSIICMTIPTVVIGLLPSYQKIGIIAPITIFICRLLQGLCVGGEYNGAAIFIIEHASKKRASYFSSLLSMSGFGGAVLGSALGALFTLSFMPAWAWRIPFLISGIIGVLGYRLRTKISESPAFEKLEKNNALTRTPLLKVLQEQKLPFFCAIAFGAAAVVPFYVFSTYLSNIILIGELQFSYSTVMALSSALMIFYMAILPPLGNVSDYLGSDKILIISCLALFILPYPIFALLYPYTLQEVIYIQILLSIANAAFCPAASVFLNRLFPPQERYSGIAVGFSLGTALFGGSAPLICDRLVSWTNSPQAPALYIMFSAALGLAAIYIGKRTLAKRNAHNSFYNYSLQN